jgi:hypothetical protein
MRNKIILLAFIILLSIIASFVLVNNVKADTSGTLYPVDFSNYLAGFSMDTKINGVSLGVVTRYVHEPTTGGVTTTVAVGEQIWLNPGDVLSVSFIDPNGNIMRTDNLKTGPGYINPANWTVSFNIYTSALYSNDAGITYGLDYTLYSMYTRVVGVSYTPYYYVTVNSDYDTPTSSQYVAQGGSLTVSVTTPVSLATGIQAICTGNTYDSASSYTFTNIQEDKSITFNWQVQYQVTFWASGLDSSAGAAPVLRYNSIDYTYNTLPTVWVNINTYIDFSYYDGVASVVHQKFYIQSVTAPHPYISGPTTISATYLQAYYQALVTFKVSGMNSSATGRILETSIPVNIVYASFPVSFWMDIGSTLTYIYTSTVPSTIEHYQYVYLGSNFSSGSAIYGSTTIVGSYEFVQHDSLITFSISGLDGSAQGTIVTINSVAKTYTDFTAGSYSFYANIGDVITYAYATPITSSTHDHQQFVLQTTINSYSPLTVTGTQTIPAVYALIDYQFSVTISQTGLDSTAQGTIVTVNGAAKTWSDLSTGSYTFWVNTGATLNYTYSSTLTSSTTGKQFTSYYTTPTVVETIYSNRVISNAYKTQYLLTLISPNGTCVGGGTYYDANTMVSFYVTPTSVSESATTQFLFASWTGTGYTGTNFYPTFNITAPTTETAIWNTQYYLTVNGVYATSTGSGWYNAGATASFSVANTSETSGARTGFVSWTGSGSGSYTGTTQTSTCTMNAPIIETANWVTQYQLTITSPYGVTSGAGWYNAGATAYASVVSDTSSNTSTTRYTFNSWSDSSTNASQSTAITMSTPTIITASWITQYYLTVTSTYGTPSGAGWYNAGATTHAVLNTNLVGSYSFSYWSGDASGGTYASSGTITMTGPKTALAVWTLTTGGSTGPATYNVTLIGPYYEDGNVADSTTVSYKISFANSTVYGNTMTAGVGVANTTFLSSTSPFMQLTWNATSTSATYNSTRIYRFANGANAINDTVIRIYIVPEDQPSYPYTFSISDYYGMTNPYMQTSVSPDGINSYVVERVNLAEGGGYVQFIMTQNQIYTLSFICTQGTSSQSFTAQVLGQPGQLAISKNVLAGDFPVANTTGTIATYAARVNSTGITVTYIDPNATTTWVNVAITHLQGITSITDYTINVTGSIQSFNWDLANPTTDYKVTITNDLDQTYTLTVPAEAGTNPWTGLFDFLGTTTNTLPVTYTGWGGIDPSQIIAAALIMAALGIGSFYSTSASCLIAWAIAGILLKLGWWQGSIPLFALAGFFTVFILIDEYKKGAINI